MFVILTWLEFAEIDILRGKPFQMACTCFTNFHLVKNYYIVFAIICKLYMVEAYEEWFENLLWKDYPLRTCAPTLCGI